MRRVRLARRSGASRLRMPKRMEESTVNNAIVRICAERETAGRCARPSAWLVLLAWLVILGGATAARGQDLYGGVVGVVNDDQGGVVPGAAVVLVNRDTGLRRETLTNTEGAYTFTNVQNGPYDVRISMAGFKEAVRANVPVAVGQISRVDVTLEIGGLSEIVEVTSPVQLLQTDKADVRSELKSGATGPEGARRVAGKIEAAARVRSLGIPMLQPHVVQAVSGLELVLAGKLGDVHRARHRPVVPRVRDESNCVADRLEAGDELRQTRVALVAEPLVVRARNAEVL